MKRIYWIGMVCLLCLVWGLPALAQDAPPPDDTETELEEPERCPMGFEPEEVDLAYFIGVGEVRFKQGDYVGAINSYTCALLLDPEYIPAMNSRGFAYYVQGNDDLALTDFNAVLLLDEANVRAYANRGVLYTRQGRFGLALSDFDLALAIAPDFAIGYNNRAVVHAIEGNYDLALADVEQAIAFAPDYPQPHATLGMIYSAMAVQSYAKYEDLSDAEFPRLPAGTADNVIVALDNSLETGGYFVWLAVQSPAR